MPEKVCLRSHIGVPKPFNSKAHQAQTEKWIGFIAITRILCCFKGFLLIAVCEKLRCTPNFIDPQYMSDCDIEHTACGNSQRSMVSGLISQSQQQLLPSSPVASLTSKSWRISDACVRKRSQLVWNSLCESTSLCKRPLLIARLRRFLKNAPEWQTDGRAKPDLLQQKKSWSVGVAGLKARSKLSFPSRCVTSTRFLPTTFSQWMTGLQGVHVVQCPASLSSTNPSKSSDLCAFQVSFMSKANILPLMMYAKVV